MKLLDRYRDRRAEKRYGPLTLDICAVCCRPLRARERVEVCEPFDPRVTEGVLSGGGMIVDFCPEHAPKEASRHAT